MTKGVKIRVARKAPVIAFIMAFFLLSACGSLATCGCNGPVGNNQKLIQKATSNETDSTTGTIVNVTPIIPHMRFEIIRPEYGEVIAKEKEGNDTWVALVAVTSAETCHRDVCKDGYAIKKVEFFDGENYLGDAIAQKCVGTPADPTTTCLWSLSKAFAPGTYNLTARAIDNKNQTEISSRVIFTVKPLNNPPQAVITRPYDNETFTYPATILVNISAWDNDNPPDKITRVELFEGTNKLNESNAICQSPPCTCSLTTPCTCNFTWDNAEPRIYSLKAIAVDEKGLSGTSRPITIVVKPNDTNGDLEQSAKAKPPKPPNDCTPSIATLISPNGTVGTKHPTYTWNSVPDATSYRLLLKRSTGDAYTKVYDIPYPLNGANLICTDQICTVQPTTDLSVGNYKWSIQTSTSNCNTIGPWSSSMSFRITGDKPIAPRPISPNGLVGTNTPTFTWTASPGSTQYRIVVQSQVGPIINKNRADVDENQTDVDENQTDVDNNLPVSNAIDQIYEADDVTSGSDCSAISPVRLWNGIFYWGVAATNDWSDWTRINFNDIGSTNYFEIVCSIPKNTSNQINDYIQGISDDAFQVDPVECKTIISEELSEATASIDSKDYQKAISRLMFVRSKADGTVDGDEEDDWITDPATQDEICKKIDDLVVNIKAVQSSNKRTQSSNERTDIRERHHRQNR